MNRRRWVRVLLTLVVIVFVAVVLVIGFLHTDTGRAYVLGRVQDFLEANQGFRLEASRLDYNLLEFSASLADVRLISRQAPELPPFLEARRIYVDLGLLSLLKGFLHLQEGLVESPRVQVVFTEAGRHNLPTPVAREVEEEAGGLPDFLIGSLRITDGSMSFVHEESRVSAALPDWDIAVEGSLATQIHELALRMRDGSAGIVSHQGRELPVSDLQFEAEIPSNLARVDIGHLHLQSDDSYLSLAGTIEDLANPTLQLEVGGEITLTQVSAIMDLSPPVAGQVILGLTVTGSPGEPTVAGQVRANNVAYEALDQVHLNSQVRLDLASSRLVIDSFAVESPEAALEGEASLTTATAGNNNLTLRISRLLLEPLARRLDLGPRIGSNLQGEVTAEWSAENLDASIAQAELHLTASQDRARREVIPFSGRLSLRKEGPEVTLRLDRVSALGARSEGLINLAELRGLFAGEPQGSLSGEVTAQIEDVEVALLELARFLGEDVPLVGTRVAGPMTLRAGLGGTIERPTARAQLNARSLTVGGLSDLIANFAVDYQNTRLQIEEAVIGWNDNRLVIDGSLEALNEPDPILDLRTRLDQANLETVLLALGRQVPARGTFSLTASATGPISEPSALAHVSGSGLSAYGEELGTLQLEGKLEGETTTVDLSLQKPEGGGQLDLAGTFNLESQAYTLDASSPRFELSSLRLGERTVTGVLSLAASGSGTVTDPAGNLRVEGEDLRYGADVLGPLSFDLTVQDQEARIEAGAARFNTQLMGTVGVQEPHQIELEARLDGTDLALLPQIGQEVEGGLQAEIGVEGELRDWRNATVSMQLRDLRLVLNGEVIEGQEPMRLAFERNALLFESVALESGASRIEIQGRMPIEESAEPGFVDLVARIALETVQAFLGGTTGFSGQGQLQVGGTLQGSLAGLSPNLDVRLDGASLELPALRESISTISMRAKVRPGEAVIQSLEATIGQGTAMVEGTIPLGLIPADLPFGLQQDPGSGSLRAQVLNFNPGVLAGVPEGLQGNVSLTAEASADRADPAALAGSIRFEQLDLNFQGLDLSQATTSVITVGDGRAGIEQFHLTGPAADLRISGSLSFLGQRDLDIQAGGQVNAAIAQLFMNDLDVEGETDFQLAAGGTMAEPSLDGFLNLAGVQIRVDSPDLRITQLNGRLDFAGNQVSITGLTGGINGGALEVGGSFSFGPSAIQDAAVNVTATDVYAEYPEGLQIASDARLQLTSQGEGFLLGGEVRIQDGAYTRPISIGEELLSQLQSVGGGVEIPREPNPFLADLSFGIDVETVQPVLVDNNLARLLATVDVRLTGTYYRPGLTGRIALEEGGELRLRERRYLVERGTVTFLSETRIQPNLDILASTTVNNVDISLQVSGLADELETTLTSNPPLPEPDIVSILVTGRRLSDVRGQEFTVAREQTLSLLTGGAARRLGAGLEEVTGLSQVRIEPQLIAAETQPGARLTIGQDLTNELQLIYSMNLRDSSDQIYIAEYEIGTRFSARVSHLTGSRQRQTDPNENSYRFEFSHQLLLGGGPGRGRVPPTPRQAREVADVSFQGEPALPRELLQDAFGVEIEQDFDFFEVREGMDRLRELYRERGYLEARVRMNREEVSPNRVRLALDIEAGPQVTIRYEGAEVPAGLRERVSVIWADGVFDMQRVDDAVEALRAHQVDRQHYDPRISFEINSVDVGKEVLFRIEPGVRYRQIELRFPGASGIPAEELEEQLRGADLITNVFTNPAAIEEFLTGYYRQRAYLDAQISDTRLEMNAETGVAVAIMPVDEGPLHRVTSVSFTGNTTYADEELLNVVTVQQNQPYDVEQARRSARVIEDVYRRRGFNGAVVRYATERDPDGDVEVNFAIEENRQQVVQEIVVEGEDETSSRMIRNQLALSEGDVLDPDKVAESRLNLYDTGAFVLVEIETSEIERNQDGQDNRQPMRLAVRVREVKPFEISYGASYDTERGAGGVTDIVNRNSLGKARTLGFRGRLDQRTRETRIYFSQPFLTYLPLQTSVTTFARRDIDPDSDFNTDRLGASFQQQTRFGDHYIFSYGYRFERTRTIDQETNLSSLVNLAPLSASLTRDTRDDLMDASRGAFTSHTLEYAPGFLGSGLRYARYYGQFFRYIPLGQPQELPWGGGEKARLVYAGGLRLGLAEGLAGEELIPGERFFAGGETTIRGFRRDALGPRGATGRSLGGEAVFIMNHEIRFPMISIFDGVGFVDVGNVYRDVRDFDLFRLRSAAGFGLRVRTPYFLLRADYGHKLDRRPGESLGAFFFSIGQAF